MLKFAPVKFVGLQPVPPGFHNDEPIALYNLTGDIEGHVKHSTLARETLEKLDYEIPFIEHDKEYYAREKYELIKST